MLYVSLIYGIVTLLNINHAFVAFRSMDNYLDNGWCYSAEISVINPHVFQFTVWDPINNTHCRLSIKLTAVSESDDSGNITTYPLLSSAVKADYFEGSSNRCYLPSFRVTESNKDTTRLILFPPGNLPPPHLLANHIVIDRVHPPQVRNIHNQQPGDPSLFNQRIGISPNVHFLPFTRSHNSPAGHYPTGQSCRFITPSAVVTDPSTVLNTGNSFIPINATRETTPVINNRQDSKKKKVKVASTFQPTTVSLPGQPGTSHQTSFVKFEDPRVIPQPQVQYTQQIAPPLCNSGTQPFFYSSGTTQETQYGEQQHLRNFPITHNNNQVSTSFYRLPPISVISGQSSSTQPSTHTTQSTTTTQSVGYDTTDIGELPPKNIYQPNFPSLGKSSPLPSGLPKFEDRIYWPPLGPPAKVPKRQSLRLLCGKGSNNRNILKLKIEIPKSVSNLVSPPPTTSTGFVLNKRFNFSDRACIAASAIRSNSTSTSNDSGSDSEDIQIIQNLSKRQRIVESPVETPSLRRVQRKDNLFDSYQRRKSIFNNNLKSSVDKIRANSEHGKQLFQTKINRFFPFLLAKNQTQHSLEPENCETKKLIQKSKIPKLKSKHSQKAHCSKFIPESGSDSEIETLFVKKVPNSNHLKKSPLSNFENSRRSSTTDLLTHKLVDQGSFDLEDISDLTQFEKRFESSSDSSSPSYFSLTLPVSSTTESAQTQTEPAKGPSPNISSTSITSGFFSNIRTQLSKHLSISPRSSDSIISDSFFDNICTYLNPKDTNVERLGTGSVSPSYIPSKEEVSVSEVECHPEHQVGRIHHTRSGITLRDVGIEGFDRTDGCEVIPFHTGQLPFAVYENEEERFPERPVERKQRPPIIQAVPPLPQTTGYLSPIGPEPKRIPLADLLDDKGPYKLTDQEKADALFSIKKKRPFSPTHRSEVDSIFNYTENFDTKDTRPCAVEFASIPHGTVNIKTSTPHSLPLLKDSERFPPGYPVRKIFGKETLQQIIYLDDDYRKRKNIPDPNQLETTAYIKLSKQKQQGRINKSENCSTDPFQVYKVGHIPKDFEDQENIQEEDEVKLVWEAGCVDYQPSDFGLLEERILELSSTRKIYIHQHRSTLPFSRVFFRKRRIYPEAFLIETSNFNWYKESQPSPLPLGHLYCNGTYVPENATCQLVSSPAFLLEKTNCHYESISITQHLWSNLNLLNCNPLRRHLTGVSEEPNTCESRRDNDPSLTPWYAFVLVIPKQDPISPGLYKVLKEDNTSLVKEFTNLTPVKFPVKSLRKVSVYPSWQQEYILWQGLLDSTKALRTSVEDPNNKRAQFRISRLLNIKYNSQHTLYERTRGVSHPEFQHRFLCQKGVSSSRPESYSPGERSPRPFTEDPIYFSDLELIKFGNWLSGPENGHLSL